jgi:DNA-binding NarL/FixJ family response regulator
VVENPDRPLKLMVVDDHRLLAQMLLDHLSDRGYEALSADVTDDQLVHRIIEISPDLLILDSVFNDDEDGGMNVLRDLESRGADIRTVLLTGVTDAVRHAELLAAGAIAVIEKSDSFDGVLAQIEDLIAGCDPMGANRRSELARLLVEHDAQRAGRAAVLADLTERELSTLQGLVDGRTVDEMASTRTVASSTVRSHVRALLRKLDAHSQVEAVAVASRAGLTPSVVLDGR